MQKLEKQFHIHCVEGDVGRYCILPGDPGRCVSIAAYFDDAKLVSQNREFTVYTGYLLGEKVTVCSTGIGGPSAAIAIEELHNIGADTFIRIGTCGGIDLDVRSGDVVIATGAVRYEPKRMPVSYELLNKWEAWKRLGVKASEMESAAMFVITSALRCRSGACFHVIWNQEREAAGLDQDMTENTGAAIKTAVEAIKLLIAADKAK